jgi:uncharacterized protein YutE (UPF0331/DUF86 family)
MTLRHETIRARLLRLEEVITQLQELGRLDFDTLHGNLRDIWAAERGLQLGAEILLDIGNHVVSGHFGAPSATYEDILEQLALHGVLSQELRQRLKGLGGFRNVLVHDYMRLDPRMVWDNLRRAPGDFSEFTLAIRGWLERV